MTKINLKKTFSITNEKFYNFIKLFIAILLGLALAFIVLVFVSDDPINAFLTIITGALTKPRYIGLVIEKFMPFVFAGLCYCILLKCGFFNLGGEGIIVASGLVLSFVACSKEISALGSTLHPIICIVVAGLVGGVLMLIPAFFKAKFGANELVLSLMLNSAYMGIATYVIKYHFLSSSTSLIASPNFLETSKVNYFNNKFCETYHISPMLIFVIVVTILVYLLMYKTKLGYQIRLVGENPKFSNYAGIDSFKLSMIANFICGVLCGFAAATYLLTQADYFQWTGNASSGIGFSGTMLAMLGQNNPIGAFVATFFIKYLEQGAIVLYYNDTSVPSEIIVIIEGAIVLLVSSTYFLRRFREKRLLKEGLMSEYRSDREAK